MDSLLVGQGVPLSVFKCHAVSARVHVVYDLHRIRIVLDGPYVSVKVRPADGKGLGIVRLSDLRGC